MHRWDSLLKDGEAVTDAALDGRMDSLKKDDCIHMQYTSGTTGFPKGVMLSHFNIVNNAANIAECMKLTSSDRLCIPVPFFHCFGCVLGVLACVSAGAAMIPIEQFSPLSRSENGGARSLHGSARCTDDVYRPPK